MTMSADQEALAAEIMDGFTPIGDVVPPDFEEFVADRIAARPSPTPPTDPLVPIIDKLDEILNLLRGGTPE